MNNTSFLPKITYNNFAYYILHIDINTNEKQIEQKLIEMQNSLANDDNLVIKFADNLLSEEILTLLTIIINLCKKYARIIYAIIHTKNISNVEIIGIQVISLPEQYITVNKILHTCKTLIIEEPVRSGMNITHDADIIITSFVSNGAEVIAKGNIHIYGDLRGRAIAGAGGDKSCKIFVQKFNPELISIAGFYRTFEDMTIKHLLNQSVIVSLNINGNLNVKGI